MELITVFLALVGFATFIYAVSKNFIVSKVVPIALKGKHVLITGGSKGIGKALAMEAAGDGANVTILARNRGQLEETCEELKAICDSNAVETGKGQKAQWFSLDMISQPHMIEETIKKAEESFGPVDVLINNAGGSVQAPFEDLPLSSFENQMRLNYLSAVYATRAVIPHMKHKNSRGRIVFISSQAGQLGLFGYTAYSGAKFALRGLAEALQMELVPYDVRVTVAFPPNTDTEGFKEELESMPKETKLISETAGLWKPETVARTILVDVCGGSPSSTFGMDGWLLGTLTAGMAPETQAAPAVHQTFLMGIFRFISLCYLKYFERIVTRCAKERDPTLAENEEDE